MKWTRNTLEYKAFTTIFTPSLGARYHDGEGGCYEIQEMVFKDRFLPVDRYVTTSWYVSCYIS